MNVPRIENLIQQTFNIEFIEFVWKFDNQLLICKIFRSPKIYMEGGEVNAVGDFINEPEILDVGYGHLPIDLITFPLNWNNKRCPEVYKNFTNGKDLIPLVKEVVDFLK